MSAATTFSPATIFVRLVGEAVDVWRPVEASRLGGDIFRLAPNAVPEDEEWEFRPGEVVRVALREDDGRRIVVARDAVSPSRRRVG